MDLNQTDRVGGGVGGGLHTHTHTSTCTSCVMAVVSRDVYQYQKFNILLSARPGEFSFWSDRGEEKLKLRCFHRRSAQADLSWLSARVETLDLIQRDGSGETLRSGWTPTLGGSTEMTELKQS